MVGNMSSGFPSLCEHKGEGGVGGSLFSFSAPEVGANDYKLQLVLSSFACILTFCMDSVAVSPGEGEGLGQLAYRGGGGGHGPRALETLGTPLVRTTDPVVDESVMG